MENIVNEIDESYRLFYDTVKGMIEPMMSGWKEKFKDYKYELEDMEAYYSDSEIQIANAFSLIDAVLYNSKHLYSYPANNKKNAS